LFPFLAVLRENICEYTLLIVNFIYRFTIHRFKFVRYLFLIPFFSTFFNTVFIQKKTMDLGKSCTTDECIRWLQLANCSHIQCCGAVRLIDRLRPTKSAPGIKYRLRPVPAPKLLVSKSKFYSQWQNNITSYNFCSKL